MDIIQAIIIGLVQGLTEFLPVSSSAHLIFAQQALGVADVGLAFDVLLHVGTLVAVIVYFFNDIVNMIKGFLLSLVDLKNGNFMGELKKDPYKKLAWLTWSAPRLSALRKGSNLPQAHELYRLL